MLFQQVQKGIFVFSFLWIILGCSSGIVQRELEPTRVKHHLDLKQDTSLVELRKFIFYYDAGEKIPISIFIDHPLVEYKGDPLVFNLKKRIYLQFDITEEKAQKIDQYISNRKEEEGFLGSNDSDLEELQQKFIEPVLPHILLSLDGKQWTPLTSKKGLQEIFLKGKQEYFLNVALSYSRKEQGKLSLNLGEVLFHDSALNDCVFQAKRKSKETDLSKITTLYCDSIHDLKGIEQLENLQELKIRYSQLRRLSPLFSLKSLRKVSFKKVSVSCREIEALAKAIDLQDLERPEECQAD